MLFERAQRWAYFASCEAKCPRCPPSRDERSAYRIDECLSAGRGQPVGPISLLHLTAGTLQPIRRPRVPRRCSSPCVLRTPCPPLLERPRRCLASFCRCPPGCSTSVMFPTSGPARAGYARESNDGCSFEQKGIQRSAADIASTRTSEPAVCQCSENAFSVRTR